MASPVIGVCAAHERARWGFWDMPAAIVASTYLSHIERAGGIGIGLIPSDSATAAPDVLLDRVDGLLLIGGVDIDPRNYGEEAGSRMEATAPMRDAFELALTTAAFSRNVPVLGICRGLQIMNVACGGTLHQHLDDLGFPEHRKTPGSLEAPSFHDIDVMPDSWAAAGVGYGQQAVNSHHHQGIARVAAGATITAFGAQDRLPEALEWRDQSYALGVQWHPEAMELGGTIGEFVAACRRHMETHIPDPSTTPARNAIADAIRVSTSTSPSAKEA